MKQLIEMYTTALIIMCIICISMQIIMTDTQLSSAKEYSGFITEKLENSGLSEKAKNKIISATNEDSKLYHVDITKAETADGKNAYHIALQYPIMTPFYDIFTKKTTINTGVINSYASIGNSENSTTDTLGLGTKEKEVDVGDCTISLYNNGTIAVISGEGEFINTFKDDEKNIFIANSDDGGLEEYDIEKIIIDKGITRIDSYSFSELSNLEQVILPSSLESLGDKVFAKTPISAITIPSKVDLLTFSMFDEMSSLNCIYIDNKKEDVDVSDFEDRDDLDFSLSFLKD